MIVPSWRDPRWTGILFLGSYVVFALLYPGFSRTPQQVLAAVLSCMLLDALLQRVVWKVPLFPLSALFPAFGMCLMCDSPAWWPFVLTGLIAIGSKHFIRSGGRHIFNPLNFAIVVMLLFMGAHLRIADERWGGYWLGAAVVATVGTVSSWRARRLDLSATYAGGFLLGAWVLSLIEGRRFLSMAAPATGAIFFLFTFSMVPDPVTTPDGRRRRIAFGLAVAGLETALRYFEIRNAPFYSLFVVGGVFSALPPEEGRGTMPAMWKYDGAPNSG
ncbi:MAG: hypothetical protein KGL53_00220 [Elusimicrobia bacterium]|nr:hypothetical protein [Elusimicrobiota bacterium]